MGDRTEAGGGCGTTGHLLSARRDLPAALCQRAHDHGQQHLQRLAHGRRLARQVAGLGPCRRGIPLGCTARTSGRYSAWGRSPRAKAATLLRNWRKGMRENLPRPLVPPTLRGVHHLALCTDDMKTTIDSYVDVLGMPLVHAMKVPPGLGTGPGIVAIHPMSGCAITSSIWAMTAFSPSSRSRRGRSRWATATPLVPCSTAPSS